MEIITKSIQRKGENLILTNQRTVFWESKKALILSDLHIGKTGHFRKHGIAVPSNVMRADLDRLQTLIEYFNPTSLIIVGDLFHAGINKEMTEFLEWRLAFKSLIIELIKGNHDRLKNEYYKSLGLNTHKPNLIKPPFRFIHDIADNDDTSLFSFSGHTHPGVSIKLKGRQRIKLPCYQLSKSQLVLPAFSKFTGLNTKSCPDDAVCIAFTESELFAIK